MQPIVGKAHRFGRAGDIELSEDYFYAIVQIGADEAAVVMFVQTLEPTMSKAPYHLIGCNVSIDTCQERELNNQKPVVASFLGGCWLSIGRSETLGGGLNIALGLFIMVYIWSEKEVP